LKIILLVAANSSKITTYGFKPSNVLSSDANGWKCNQSLKNSILSRVIFNLLFNHSSCLIILLTSSKMIFACSFLVATVCILALF